MVRNRIQFFGGHLGECFYKEMSSESFDQFMATSKQSVRNQKLQIDIRTIWRTFHAIPGEIWDGSHTTRLICRNVCQWTTPDHTGPHKTSENHLACIQTFLMLGGQEVWLSGCSTMTSARCKFWCEKGWVSDDKQWSREWKLRREDIADGTMKYSFIIIMFFWWVWKYGNYSKLFFWVLSFGCLYAEVSSLVRNATG